MKFSLITVLCLCCCAVILGGLGLWQLERLKWKTDLISRLEAAYANDAAASLLNASYFTPEHEFNRGSIIGTPLIEKSLQFGLFTKDGIAGYHLITPFKLAQSEDIILVNRGWVPQNYTQTHETEKTAKQIRLNGMIRKPPEPNFFTPLNFPQKNIWFRMDITEIAKEKSLKHLKPMLFIAENTYDSEPFPIPLEDIRKNLKNNHLQYALFWFAMLIAFIAVIIIFQKNFLSSSESIS